MKLVEIKLKSTLEHAQLGSIAAAHIARAYCSMALGTGLDGDDDTFINEVELAVGEACTNAARYNPDPNKDLDLYVSFKLQHNEFIVIIKDQNKPFEFDTVPEPDYDSIPEGGYGISLMKATMDEVSYAREDGWNIITMKKRLSKKQDLT